MKKKPTGRSRFKQRDGIQSEQERDVKILYPQLQFKPPAIPYVSTHNYNPDFKLGTYEGKVVYLELKEYMTTADIPKYRAVLESNPHVIIAFLIYSASYDVFQKLGVIPRVWVAQGYVDIPREWLTKVKLPTIKTPTDTQTDQHIPPSIHEL
ncbi:endonuclease [Plectonema phage JingP1]|uniref:Endonuclease n=1 Tax=Plectonema phage JingP1 TaxID=2961687 RepID=A0A9E7T1H8_9CAUD|nr:endonuclease [Plectonema phage JingP1]